MKGFFKTFFAALLAMIVVSLLPILILVGVLSSSLPSSESVVVEDGSVLVMDFAESIYDSPRMPTLDLSGLSSGTMEMMQSLTTLQVIEALEAAAADPKIKALYINHTGLGTIEGTAQMEELRNLLVGFKASGKPIVAYNETYSQGLYWLCSVADELYLNPQGALDWRGLASQVMFYKGLLDKLDLDVQIVRHGTYKSAVEPYITKQMSDANRLQTRTMVNSLWNVIIEDVALARNLSPHYIHKAAEGLLIDSPASAKTLGFVDELLYEDQVEARLAAIVGKEKFEDVNTVTLGEYVSTLIPTKIARNKVAVVYADGEIIDGQGAEGIIGGATTAEHIRRAAEDDDVKAVVLRVNSPGGSALASEVMWRELKLLVEKKPLVVSMANYAASGGYYISSPASTILSARTTLTGSIGVFGMILSTGDAMKNVGITVDVAKSAPHGDMGTAFRKLTPTELDYLQKSVEDVYGTFIGHVADGRGMTTEDVDKIGQGRVWCGVDAKTIGLVDGFGGLKEALAIAAEKAELGEGYRVVEILEEEDEFTALMNSLLSASARTALKEASVFGESLGRYNALRATIEEGSGVKARMPYDIAIY
ncbi:MAG: signal peptide peptidase SppA [Tidjanibacter sp.]|nr:signal peptide peptidase SppA [Tidjanibacter sp.]